MAKRVVEVLTFAGCPHGDPALEVATRVVREIGAEAEVRRVDVADAEGAVVERFLGSPTIRVDGRDVEPGADKRTTTRSPAPCIGPPPASPVSPRSSGCAKRSSVSDAASPAGARLMLLSFCPSWRGECRGRGSQGSTVSGR
jgi:hypothetical protein